MSLKGFISGRIKRLLLLLFIYKINIFIYFITLTDKCESLRLCGDPILGCERGVGWGVEPPAPEQWTAHHQLSAEG